MISTLKGFQVVDTKNEQVISEFFLKLNGFRYELHTKTEVITSGIEAYKEYENCLALNKLIAETKGYIIKNIK